MEVQTTAKTLHELKQKIDAFTILFGVKPVVSISGLFKDRSGEWVFLSYGFTPVVRLKTKYLTIRSEEDKSLYDILFCTDEIANIRLRK